MDDIVPSPSGSVTASISGVGVIDKAMLIVDALAGRPCTLNDLVETSGLNRATAHRLASALCDHGMARRLDDGRFALGYRLLELGRRVAEELPLAAIAQPILEQLRTETQESAQLYVQDGSERVCVAAAESEHGLRTIVPVGRRLTMAKGSAALVLLGRTPDTGYAVSVGEREPGVASVSAPVHDASRRVVAAISVSGPIDRTSTDPGHRYGHQVIDAATDLETALGWR
ncbi:MAG: IclR family transcriptional regulator [Acidimicrobiales bacterium]